MKLTMRQQNFEYIYRKVNFIRIEWRDNRKKTARKNFMFNIIQNTNNSSSNKTLFM